MRLTKAMGGCHRPVFATVLLSLSNWIPSTGPSNIQYGVWVSILDSNEIEQNKRSITFHVGFFVVLSILNSTMWRFETTTRWDDNESIRISKILSNIEPRHPILLTRPSFIGSILDGHRAHSHVYWSRCQNLPHRLWPSILRLLGIDMHSSLH